MASALRSLADDYVLVRNLWLPGSAGDIDGVLLPPAGALWVLEVKALDGRKAYRCHGLTWEYLHPTRRQWLRLDTQPSRQALFHANQVKSTLDGAGLPAYPRAAVVLATGADVALRAPRVPIVGIHTIGALVAAGRSEPAAPQEMVLQALLRAARK